jgi:hypothetical protein
MREKGLREEEKRRRDQVLIFDLTEEKMGIGQKSRLDP